MSTDQYMERVRHAKEEVDQLSYTLMMQAIYLANVRFKDDPKAEMARDVIRQREAALERYRIAVGPGYATKETSDE